MSIALWIFGLPKNRTVALNLLKKLGYGVVTVGKDKHAVDAIIREGLEAHVVHGAFSLREKECRKKDLLSQRLDGTPVQWFGSGCPNNAKIRESGLRFLEEAASMEGAKAVILDGIRFASPGEGIETFMTCFCNFCRQKARDLGYDMDEMKKSLRNILKSINNMTPSILKSISYFKSPIDVFSLLSNFPGALEWLGFRAECIVEYVREARKVVRSVNRSCKIGAYLFSPSLSYLVGQDYRRLSGILDYVEPMIYRTGKGVACINYEVAKIVSDIHKRGHGLNEIGEQEFVFNFLGLDVKSESSINKLAEGISFEVVESEIKKAMSFVESRKLVPILFLDDPLILKCVEGALRAGTRNISFFHFHDCSENTLRAVSFFIRKCRR